MTSGFDSIPIAGGDTATPRNMAKRLRLIAKNIVVPGARVLDAGCGAGEYVAALSRMGAVARGVEYLPEKVAQWRVAHPDDSSVQCGDIARVQFDDDVFDAVLLNEVLEHVPNEIAVLREMRRVVRPGGKLLLFSPNRRYPFETHGVDSHRTGERIAPIKTLGLPYLPLAVTRRLVRPWARNYWPSDLRHLVIRAGFRIIAHDFVWQTFENISHRQGALLRLTSPLLRLMAATAERVSVVRTLGASQLIVATKD